MSLIVLDSVLSLFVLVLSIKPTVGPTQGPTLGPGPSLWPTAGTVLNSS